MTQDLKKRAPRNRTLTVELDERERLLAKLIVQRPRAAIETPVEGTILGDFRE